MLTDTNRPADRGADLCGLGGFVVSHGEELEFWIDRGGRWKRFVDCSGRFGCQSSVLVWREWCSDFWPDIYIPRNHQAGPSRVIISFRRTSIHVRLINITHGINKDTVGKCSSRSVMAMTKKERVDLGQAYDHSPNSIAGTGLLPIGCHRQPWNFRL